MTAESGLEPVWDMVQLWTLTRGEGGKELENRGYLSWRLGVGCWVGGGGWHTQMIDQNWD